MKQPTDQCERNEDKKKPEEDPSRGIDPKPEKEEEMEVVDQAPGSPESALFAFWGGGPGRTAEGKSDPKER